MERKLVTLDDIDRRLVSAHVKPYYDWIRRVISLSTVSLTLSVSLQSHYIPKEEPKWVWLLALCWVSLAISVLFGVLALRGEYKTPLDAARELRQSRIDYGDEAAASAAARNPDFKPKDKFKWAQRVMIFSFVSGVVSLAFFAVRNLPHLF
jgi:hypothetical protein